MASEEKTPQTLLQPGMIIAPQIKLETARRLVEELYGLKVKSMKEINSYDDKNYKVDVETEHSNPHIKHVASDGYILKVLNTMDSPKQHVDAEHAMCHLLSKHDVMCPIPELNIHGNEKSLEKLPIETNEHTGDGTLKYSVHLVRLMHFIPGIRLFDVPYTPDILVQSGELLGKIDLIIKDFTHPGVDHHTTVWSLTSLPQLRDFIHAVTDPDRRQLVEDIIKAFEEEVEPNYHKYTKAVIHGDFNEQNIIVSPVENNQMDDNQNTSLTKHKVRGVIDFGDASSNYIPMELGIAVTYHMIESMVVDPLDAGGYFLAGFYRHLSLNAAERDALKVLVAGRLCQSLVMGAYTNMQDPSNTYVLTTAKKGWPLMKLLWEMPKEELYARWQQIIDKVNDNN